MRQVRFMLLAFAALAIAAWLLWPRSEQATAPDAPAPAAEAAPAVEEPPHRDLAPGSLAGEVRDRHGPVARAEVRLLAGQRAIAATSTDASGAFRFSGVDAGDYLLLARSEGLASEPLGPVPLAPGEALEGLVLQLAAGGTLSGVVRDAATGDTIEGARVSTAGLAVTTDRAGRFRFGGLPPGPAILRAGAEGYESREQPLEEAAGTVELLLTRGAKVSGRVVDGAGKGVAGASVGAVPYRFGGAAEFAPEATTDVQGMFTVTAPAGPSRIHARGPAGGSGASEPLDLAAGSSREGVIVRLAGAASLEGVVVDSEGHTAPGAEVRAATAAGSTLDSAICDAEGRFVFPELPPGPVQVVALHGRQRGIAGPFVVAEGGHADVVVQLGSSVLEGVVVDGLGRPLAGATVAAWPEGSPRSLAGLATTGPDGSFHYLGISGGPLRVEASLEGRKGELRGVLADTPGLRIAIGSGWLDGLVLVDGRPAGDFAVAASPLDAGSSGSASQRFVTADGRFRLPLPPGRWEMRVGSPGAGVARAEAEIPADGPSVPVVFEIPAGLVLEGIVRERATGRPLDGVRVALDRHGTFAFGQAAAVPGAPLAVTGADGRFRLSGVPAGNVPVFAWKPGFQPIRPVHGQAGGFVEIVLAAGEKDPEQPFAGVGMAVAHRDGAFVAANVFGGGPAWEAGVRRGDLIRTIDGAPVKGMSLGDIVNRIRGPVGTPVMLGLTRGETSFTAVPVRAEVRF